MDSANTVIGEFNIRRSSVVSYSTVEVRSQYMTSDRPGLDAAGKHAAYITNEWSEDPAIMQTQALCYVGLQLKRIADVLEDEAQ